MAELKATGSVQPRLFREVAVLFVDLADFTAWCHAHPPEEVVADVQRLAEAFEEFADRHGMEKIKTIGDAFMATANLLQPHGDPVMAAIRCCYDMADAARRDPNGWRIRAGFHIGPVVAGVVGRTKFNFDLWGDTVNVAARLICDRRGGRRPPLVRRVRAGAGPLYCPNGRANPAQRQRRNRGVPVR